MASPLFTFPPETVKSLRDLRFKSARASTPQARIYEISKTDMSVKTQDNELYTSLEDIVDALPGNTPRYIVVSYPMITSDGRQKTPFVMVYYLPVTATQQAKMMYASAVEIVRAKADVNRLIEIAEEEELLEIEAILNE
ncbi:hypothetical protein V1512DRAFT_239542 [Lipomyces arxii]|uniref:uncharacterized protein n=1 Tax=Lipomyces arxii TaxID=56418 RepID=UPI0034CEFCF0